MDPIAQQELKNALSTQKIDIFHETSTLQENECEVVFTMLAKSAFSPASQAIIDEYVRQNPVANSGLSPASLQFLSAQPLHNVLILGQVSKNALFEKQELDFIKENAANYVSKKLVGEPVSYSKDFEALFNKFTFRTGVVVVGAAELAQDAFQKTLQTIQSTNAKEVLNAGSEKFGAMLGGWRNKLKEKISASESSQRPKP